MNNYYFVAASLPRLQIGLHPEIGFQEFETLLSVNLAPQDYAKTHVIRLYYDIQNIRSLWKGEELDPFGNLAKEELEEALVVREGLPGYVYDFLDSYEGTKSCLHHFPSLVTAYFREELEHASGFLKTYLQFERALRLVLVGFRAKQLGRDLIAEMQYEDPDDELIAQIIAQKDAKSYSPPIEFQEVKTIFDAHAQDPLALHQALCVYQEHQVSEMLGVDFFSIDYILGYMVKLILVEKWMQLDKKKGMEHVQKILSHST